MSNALVGESSGDREMEVIVNSRKGKFATEGYAMRRVNPASASGMADDVVSWPGKIGKSVEYKTAKPQPGLNSGRWGKKKKRVNMGSDQHQGNWKPWITAK